MGPKDVEQPEFIIANKIKLHREEALSVAREAQEVWVAQRSRLIKFAPAADATDDELAAVILGRSGTLRAPAFHVGDVFVVGYHAEGYSELFD